MSTQTQLGEAFVPIRATLDKLDGDLKSARGKVEGALSGIGKIANGVGSSLSSVGKIVVGALAGIGAAAVGAATAVAGLGVKAAFMAGSFQEATYVAEAIGEKMGFTTEQIHEQIAAVQAAGIRYDIASTTVAQLMRNEIDLSKSVELVKIAQATGIITQQDSSETMGELIHAITTGSTVMLRHMGIFIDNIKVEEDYAKSIGKSVDELTDAERMNARVNAIIEDSAAIMGVYDKAMESPTKRWRSFTGRILPELIAKMGGPLLGALGSTVDLLTDTTKWLSNAADEGGWLYKIFGTIGSIASSVFSTVAGKIEGALPTIESLGETFASVLQLFKSGDIKLAIERLVFGLADAFGMSRKDAFKLAASIGEFIDKVKDAIQRVKDFITPIWEAISGFVSWKDILITLGISIGAYVLPIIAGLIGAVVSFLAPILAVVAVVALLRNAWENDWGGIRTSITTWWNETGKPIFDQLVAWLQVNIPIAIQTLKDFWTNTLLPALQTFWNWIQTTVFPIIQTLWNWLATNVPIAIQTLTDFWNNTLLPALQNFWNWVQTTVFPIIQTLWDWLATNVPIAIQTLADFWNNTLLPAFQAAWDFISTYILPIIQDIIDIATTLGEIVITALAGYWENTLLPALQNAWDFFNENILPILNDVWSFISDNLSPVIEGLGDKFNELKDTLETGVKGALEWLHEKLEKIKEFLDNFKLPDWLTPGSPTPFEIGLRGISKAMMDLTTMKLPAMAMQLERVNTAGGPSNFNETSGFQFENNKEPIQITIQGTPDKAPDQYKLALQIVDIIKKRGG